MLNLSEEQQKALMEAVNKHIQEETKKNLVAFDKTLDGVTDKLKDIGWTLPTELGIYAINLIGNTEEIDDIERFFEQYFTQNDYKVAKEMINNILNTPISEGLKKWSENAGLHFKVIYSPFVPYLYCVL